MPPLAAGDVDELLAGSLTGFEQMPSADRGRHGQVGPGAGRRRCSYASAIGEMMTQMGRGADPISALAALLSPDGALNHACRFCYELRLRARGYGALKAILEILAAEEPLTLTEISIRLRRTPGSTKDYLSWLEDVDLVTSRQKRYSFADPLLRVWVAALPPHAAHDRGSGARGAVIRIRATAPECCAAGGREPERGAGAGLRRGGRRRAQELRHHRNRRTRSREAGAKRYCR